MSQDGTGQSKQAQQADEDVAPAASQPPRRGPSLKARAVSFLSRREHSRVELARKLQRHCDDAQQIEAVLDSLQKEGWLSDSRYAQSVVQRRGARHGAARVVQELRRSGVDDALIREARTGLQASEYERALAVWQKRYAGKPASTPAERARQARFLAARGFGGEVIARVIKGLDPQD